VFLLPSASFKIYGDLGRHFKTEPIETLAFSFGVTENIVSSSQLILLACSTTQRKRVFAVRQGTSCPSKVDCFWERLTCVWKSSGFWNTYSYKIIIKTCKIPWGTHILGQRHGVPQGILTVFIITLYENVFQNPELLRTQVSLSHSS
jgi:hypothetical protein